MKSQFARIEEAIRQWVFTHFHFLQAEELIKQEMLIMLHHDCAYNPTASQLGITPGKKNQPSQKSVVNQAAHIAFLEEHPLEKISEADLDLVSFRR